MFVKNLFKAYANSHLPVRVSSPTRRTVSQERPAVRTLDGEQLQASDSSNDRAQVDVDGDAASLPVDLVSESHSATPSPLNRALSRYSPNRGRRDSIDPKIMNIEFIADAVAIVPEYHLPSESLDRPVSRYRRVLETSEATRGVLTDPPKSKSSRSSTGESRMHHKSDTRSSSPIAPTLIFIPPPPKIDKATSTEEVLVPLRRRSPPQSPSDEQSSGVPLRKIIEMEQKHRAVDEVQGNSHQSGQQGEMVTSADKSGYLSDSSGPVPIDFDLSVIESKLRVSSHPIADLYGLFGHVLSPVENSKLLKAAMDDDSSERKSAIVSTLFKPLGAELRSLRSAADKILKLFGDCERLGALLLHASGLAGPSSAEILIQTAEEFRCVLGELKYEMMIYDMNLLEFRLVFEKLNAEGASVLQTMTKLHADFADAYAVFINCQSLSVDFKRKLAAAVEFDSKITLNSKVLMEHTVNASPVDTKEFEKLRESYNQLKDDIQTMESQLLEANSIIRELEKELFEAVQSIDRTPSALLFFTALNDVTTTENLQRLVVQLKKLKGFVDCKVHMDFVDLRQRLQTCLISLPYIERFLSSFKQLHMEWTKRRLALFERSKAFGENDDVLDMVMGSSKSFTVDHRDRKLAGLKGKGR